MCEEFAVPCDAASVPPALIVTGKALAGMACRKTGQTIVGESYCQCRHY